jgi:hypothetical protein
MFPPVESKPQNLNILKLGLRISSMNVFLHISTKIRLGASINLKTVVFESGC